MRFFLVLLATAGLLASPAHAQDGVVVKSSANSVAATVDKLEGIVREKGFTVVARVDHAAAAASVGDSLRPTEVLIFGNPKVGTALMKSRQSIGLDLPIRVVVWADEDGKVWIGYNDPAWLTGRYGVDDRAEVVKRMTGALGKFTDAAGS